MKNGKKITAAISASAVVAAMAAPVVASASTVTFTDINGNFAQAAIQKLADAGIVHGTDGKFNPNGTINKQDFVIILVNALGLDVSSAPATPSFSDVPATSYAYKYVEAAKKAGIVHGDENGKFGYNTDLQRQQMALMFANAAGADVTGKASKNNFSDNAKIGSWAADAVGYAVEQGWIHGFDGKFDPTGSATRAQVAVVASAFLDTVSVNKDLKIVASATQTTIGQKVTLSVPGATNVVWSVDKNGVIDASGNFVGTAVGTATVTATVNGKTLTQAISVAGAAETVKFAAVKDMAANGETEQTITVNAVDANGNVDTTYTGDVQVVLDSNSAVDYAPATDQPNSFSLDGSDLSGLTAIIHLTNGVGTFAVIASENPGLTSTFTATFDNAVDNTVHTAQVSVNTVEQVATKVELTPSPTTLSVNNTATTGTVAVDVLDQDGVSMKVGTYAVHVSLTGAGTFGDGTTDAYDTTYTAGQPLNIDIQSIKGQPGAITVTATSEGLTTATATVKTVVAQDASKLVLNQVNTLNTDNSWAQGNDGLELQATTADVNGYGTGVVDAAHDAVTVFAYNADGTVATNLTFGSVQGAEDQAMTSAGVPLSSVVNLDGTFFVNDLNTDQADAGDYTIVLKDSTYADANVKSLAASTALKVKETANIAAAFSLSSATTVLPSNNPTTTFTVQLTDANGNAVKEAGHHVLFHASGVKGTNANVGTAKFNGGIAQATPQTTVVTDADGKATVSFSATAYDGNIWTVGADATDAADSGFAPISSVDVTVAANPASKLTLAYADAQTGSKYDNNKSYAVAGDALDFTIDMVNAYGDEALQANDTVKAVVSKLADVSANADDTYTTDANGNYVFTGTASEVEGYLDAVVAHTVGNVTVTVSDLSNPSVAAATTSFHTIASIFDGFVVADSTGSSAVTVAANTPVALTLFAADAYGNRVAAPVHVDGTPYHLNFGDLVDDNSAAGAQIGGDFRLTQSGASLLSTGLDLAPGATKTIYYVNSKAGTYDLSATEVVAP